MNNHYLNETTLNIKNVYVIQSAYQSDSLVNRPLRKCSKIQRCVLTFR